MTLLTEDPVVPRGSCCDDGRYEVVKGCGNFWYNCGEAYDHMDKTWLRFGANGFTIPLATEHLGKCTYTVNRDLCTLPSGCQRRVPLTLQDKCGEIPHVLRIMKPVAAQ